MKEMESGAIQLELKYCERCGGLWLRPGGSYLVFCGPCDKVMAGLMTSSRSSLSELVRRDTSAAQNPFWSEGGRA